MGDEEVTDGACYNNYTFSVVFSFSFKYFCRIGKPLIYFCPLLIWKFYNSSSGCFPGSVSHN